jgi:hypothetical protein
MLASLPIHGLHYLSKAGWSWAVSQPWIPAAERCGLQTHIAARSSFANAHRSQFCT